MMQRMLRAASQALIGVLAGLVIVCNVQAVTTWTGNGDGKDWFDPANWDNGRPEAGYDAVISSGNVLLTNSTAALSSLLLTNASLTFSNWTTRLVASNVTIQSGATLTHVANSATSTNALGEWIADARVWIVCADFELQAGGAIDVSGCGYLGATNNTTYGHGPGGGRYSSSAGAGTGASHGGRGGRGFRAPFGSHRLVAQYGVVEAPETPGSGAAGDGPGAGGGVIRIEASGTVTVNGELNANGKDKLGGNGGGGSGGSIFIQCETFAGTSIGLISARGGGGTVGASGGGGGGRVAVHYDTDAQHNAPLPEVQFDLSGGSGQHPGEHGTLFLTDDVLLTPELSNFTGVQFRSDTNWTVSHLSLIGQNLTFSGAFELDVTGAVTLDNTTLRIGTGFDGPRTEAMWYIEDEQSGFVRLDCDTLTLDNASRLMVFSGPTNSIHNEYGARVHVGGNLSVAGNCWIYPYSDMTNGGSVFFTVGNLTIHENGGFDAVGLGHDGGIGAGVEGGSGYGTGGGGPGQHSGGGGGYGGKGASARNGSGGIAHGFTNMPVHAGSGGGGGTAGYNGRAGGGLIWIHASGAMTVDGILRADGIDGGAYIAAGSGGGIFLAATGKFHSGVNAFFSAEGGSVPGAHIYDGGPGGGGRIAIWHRIPEAHQQTIMADPDNAAAHIARLETYTNLVDAGFAGTFSVTNGTGHYTTAEAGSFVVLTMPPPIGTLLLIK